MSASDLESSLSNLVSAPLALTIAVTIVPAITALHHQSINQPTNQSTNPSTNQSINQSASLSMNHSGSQSINQSHSSSRARLLTPEESQQLHQSINQSIKLSGLHDSLNQSINQSIPLIAPNLIEILGSQLTAKLLSLTQGLAQLAEIPACNIPLIGYQSTNRSINQSSNQHIGLIGECPLLVNVPPSLKRKVSRLIGGKVSLMARVDHQGDSIDGSIGRSINQSISQRIDQLLTPHQSINPKALPVPITSNQNQKRRGGRRARARKMNNQSINQSIVAKNMNRMAFGEHQLIDELTGQEFGLAGKQGAIRFTQQSINQPNNKKTNLGGKMTKEMKKRINQSTNQSNNPFGNQSINQSINQSGTATFLGAASSINQHGIQLAPAMATIKESNKYFD